MENKDILLRDFLTEANTISNYLKQQLSSGAVRGDLYKQQIMRFIKAYELLKNSQN
jgi:hypothetical protein